MSEAIEKTNLAQRTRLRNASLWTNLDWGGLMAPLAAQQTAENLLAGAAIENPMAVSDENWDIKEYQRDRSYTLNQAEVTQEKQIAIDKVATGQAKLVIQRATDAYTLAVRVYDARVKALLMGAREYAAQVELEQLAVAESQAILAVAKEAVHLEEVNAKNFYEYIQRLMVETEIAKYQVDIAKAHVQASLADIAASEADIKVIETEIQQAVAQADKASLQASVAMIYAEILSKKLSTVKLDIGQKEIEAGFGYIQSRLDDALAKLATQQIEETLQIDYETSALSEVNRLLVDEKVSENLRETEMLNAQAVLDFTKVETATNIEDETALRQTVVVAKENLADTHEYNRGTLDNKSVWAQQLENTARRAVYASSVHTTHTNHTAIVTNLTMTHDNEYISAS